MANTLVKIVVNTLLGIILIVVWLQFVDIGEVISHLSQVKPVSILPIFLFFFLSAAARALRLKVFLAPIKKVAAKDLIFLTGVAMMLNFLIPVRAGEIGKAVYLNTQYVLDVKKSLVWIFLDRFIDFLVVLSLASVLFFIVPSNLPQNVIYIFSLIFAVALLLTFLMVYKVSFARKLFKLMSYLLIVDLIKIYFERIYEFFLESFSILRRHPKDLVLIFLITVLAYGFDAAVWYYAFVAINNPQPVLMMYLGQLISALTYLIPAAPGYVGSAEASGLLIFSGVFGLPANIASSMVVLFHISASVFVLVYGIISVYFLKINLGVIISRALKRS